MEEEDGGGVRNGERRRVGGEGGRIQAATDHG